MTDSAVVALNGEETVSFSSLSRKKLENVAYSLSEWIPDCPQIKVATDSDSVGYRSRCGFQFIPNETGHLQYAIRKNQQPVVILNYPIANHRIQTAMATLLEQLNCGKQSFDLVKCGLTGVSFSSSWQSDLARLTSDCLVTFHYDSSIADPVQWKVEAQLLCTELKLSQIAGRSRKRLTYAVNGVDMTVNDTLWLVFSETKDNWQACLSLPLDNFANTFGVKRVDYEKPEGAFSHPNASVMYQALSWIINCMYKIKSNEAQGLHLLEMHCGCGAHTMALYQSNILDRIVAIEIDERLVAACRRNFNVNKAHGASNTALDIVSEDAGKWAAEKKSGLPSFNVLLVDPPKQGLQDQVLEMATRGTFQHMLYISCGHHALARDLERLDKTFEVIDCCILDLFPQTYAVETLLHLRRRDKTG